MSRSWTPPPSIVGPLTAGVTRMADLLGFSPGTLLQELVDSIANHLVGREVQISFGDASVRLTVTHAHVTPAPAGLMLGQLGSVELEARDVQWADRRVDDLSIEARNVHVSAGNPHALVAAPILFTASLTEPTIAALVADANPRLSVTLAGDPRVRQVARSRNMGSRRGRAADRWIDARPAGDRCRHSATASRSALADACSSGPPSAATTAWSGAR